MKYLRRFVNDIRRGENIELYVTVIASIILAVVSLIGIAAGTWIAPLNLAILAMLAYSMLGNRHRMDELFQQFTRGDTDVFLTKWPDQSLQNDLKSAKDLFVVGVSLRRTISNNYALLEEKLRRGDAIRVLVVSPDSAAIEMAANRVYRNIDIDRTRIGTQTTLRTLCHLKQITGGNLEIRTIDYPLTVGGIFIDSDTAQGALYLEYYTFKMPDFDIPKFELRSRDGTWYVFFSRQGEVLWENGVPWGC